MNPAEDQPLEMQFLLRKFLTIPTCPPDWKFYNLYLFRDEAVVFYIGQSHCAFERVWEHLLGGIHGHSIMGRFVLANWPRSGRFIIELHSAQDMRFASVAHNLDAAERALIEQYRPCYNVSLNAEPTALPAGYLPANAPIKYLKSFKRMLREAAYASRFDETDTEWQ